MQINQAILIFRDNFPQHFSSVCFDENSNSRWQLCVAEHILQYFNGECFSWFEPSRRHDD
jgi:hypothetical protein